MTYRPPDLLPPEREERLCAALDAAEIGVAPVVAPLLTVWVRVVQLLDGRLHREPARAELSGGLRTGSPGERRRLADHLRLHRARVMTTLWAAGSETRALAWTRDYAAVDETAGGASAALSLVLRLPRRAETEG
jgi:hypothetical protein